VAILTRSRQLKDKRHGSREAGSKEKNGRNCHFGGSKIGLLGQIWRGLAHSRLLKRKTIACAEDLERQGLRLGRFDVAANAGSQMTALAILFP
jgi:hypothetical protein